MTRDLRDIEMRRVPVTTARAYCHEVDLRPDWRNGVVELELTHLAVDHDVVGVGQVTLTARGADAEDAYGYEFDLTPEAARALAGELLAAAAPSTTRLPVRLERIVQ